MSIDPQHDKEEEEEEEEQVQLPEEVEKRFQLEKIEAEQNIDTQSCPGSRPPPETETGNSVNGSVPAKCEVEGEAAEVYESDNKVKTDAEYDGDTR